MGGLLKPNTVIYFEDPFGKTEPENVQIFKSELDSIIERIQNSKSMAIITSRLDIFKEIGDPDEFPMIVELMKHDISYDLAKRKRIIDRYISVNKPAWRELVFKDVNGVSLKKYIARELTANMCTKNARKIRNCAQFIFKDVFSEFSKPRLSNLLYRWLLES